MIIYVSFVITPKPADVDDHLKPSRRYSLQNTEFFIPFLFFTIFFFASCVFSLAS